MVHKARPTDPRYSTAIIIMTGVWPVSWLPRPPSCTVSRALIVLHGTIESGSVCSALHGARVACCCCLSGDGKVDYEEFLAATMHLGKLEREENLYRAFQVNAHSLCACPPQQRGQGGCSHAGLTRLCCASVVLCCTSCAAMNHVLHNPILSLQCTPPHTVIQSLTSHYFAG